MAEKLLAAGMDLAVWNRSPEATELFADRCYVASSPAELFARSEIVAMCLPTGQIVRQVVAEALPGMVAGGVVVDHSTISPVEARELADLARESGHHYLDAPVSGGPEGAKAGTLAIMLGADEELASRVAPVVDVYASNVFQLGAVGQGQVAKLANNMCLGLAYLGIQEAFEVATRQGVDPAVLWEVLKHATADSHTLRTRPPAPGISDLAPASRDWKPGFTTAMMMKDMRLADDLAGCVGLENPGIKLLLDRLEQSEQSGYGENDFSVFAELFRARPADEDQAG